MSAQFQLRFAELVASAWKDLPDQRTVDDVVAAKLNRMREARHSQLRDPMTETWTEINL